MTPAPVVRIHFQSPPDDEHKIPRPFILKAADDPGGIEVLGGELPGTFVGLIDTLDPPAMQLEDDQFVVADHLLHLLDGHSALGDVPKYRDWYPVMAAADGSGQWQTFDMKVDRVEFRFPDPPLTGTKDIDWLRSEIEQTVNRTKGAGISKPIVRHRAIFAIEPGGVPDMHSDYGTYVFRPTFARVHWVDGEVGFVHLSGKRVLKDGRLGQQTVDAEWGYKNSSAMSARELARIPAEFGAAMVVFAHSVDLLSPTGRIRA